MRLVCLFNDSCICVHLIPNMGQLALSFIASYGKPPCGCSAKKEKEEMQEDVRE